MGGMTFEGQTTLTKDLFSRKKRRLKGGKEVTTLERKGRGQSSKGVNPAKNQKG